MWVPNLSMKKSSSQLSCKLRLFSTQNHWVMHLLTLLILNLWHQIVCLWGHLMDHSSKWSILSQRSCRCCWHSQTLTSQFWSRFNRKYLSGLQVRQKWHSFPPKHLDKALVVLVDPQLWPIEHITKIHHGDDGYIRSADVNIKGRVYTRPIAELVMLPAVSSPSSEPLEPDW